MATGGAGKATGVMNPPPCLNDLRIARNLITQFITGSGRQPSNESVTSLVIRMMERQRIIRQLKARRKNLTK